MQFYCKWRSSATVIMRRHEGEKARRQKAEKQKGEKEKRRRGD